MSVVISEIPYSYTLFCITKVPTFNTQGSFTLNFQWDTIEILQQTLEIEVKSFKQWLQVRVRTKLTNRRNMRNFVRHLNHNNNKNCISIAKLNTFCFEQGLVSCVSSAIASHLHQLGFRMSRDSETGLGVLGFLSMTTPSFNKKTQSLTSHR